MAAESFEKTNISWQIQLFLQRASEWWELQTAKIPVPDIPQLEIPGLREAARIAGLAIAFLLAFWLLWRLFEMLVPYLFGLTYRVTRATEAETPIAEVLPVDIWLQRSRQFQSQGNYREACRCLYMALLQRLNDTGIVPHQSSRTDREYLQLLRQNLRIEAYQTLLQIHEQLCFGNLDITADILAQCQQAYREIERKS